MTSWVTRICGWRLGGGTCFGRREAQQHEKDLRSTGGLLNPILGFGCHKLPITLRIDLISLRTTAIQLHFSFLKPATVTMMTDMTPGSPTSGRSMSTTSSKGTGFEEPFCKRTPTLFSSQIPGDTFWTDADCYRAKHDLGTPGCGHQRRRLHRRGELRIPPPPPAISTPQELFRHASPIAQYSEPQW